MGVLYNLRVQQSVPQEFLVAPTQHGPLVPFDDLHKVKLRVP